MNDMPAPDSLAQIPPPYTGGDDDPRPDFRLSPRYREAIASIVRDRLGREIGAMAKQDLPETLQVLAFALEDLGAGCPELAAFDGMMRDSALFWASIASPPELEAYAAAAWAQIGKQLWGSNARKRLFAQLWRGLDSDDQLAFLHKVLG